ncbi:MAG: U32 family peptidase C-terminal domain-containing protein, partial [Bacillota bacterium]
TLTFEQRNYFEEGDMLERFSPSGEALTFQVRNLQTKDGEKVAVARHPKQMLTMDAPFEMGPYDILRKVQS